MSQRAIKLDAADYNYVAKTARALGVSVQVVLKQIIDRQKRLDSDFQSGGQSRWARFAEQVKENPPLSGAGELVRHYAAELRDDFALTKGDHDDGR